MYRHSDKKVSATSINVKRLDLPFHFWKTITYISRHLPISKFAYIIKTKTRIDHTCNSPLKTVTQGQRISIDSCCFDMGQKPDCQSRKWKRENNGADFRIVIHTRKRRRFPASISPLLTWTGIIIRTLA